ncbi:TIGR03617 family F420-dependent LLM class oxidoreductase [Mycobacterium sp. CVI_P3]|uniref:TIGR03617 family F420-dependent LLM class oxidoreductase n=1 Tax=Mycobacterium pinniadriaticum TaxID=2994102 RepID=A0ABT3SNW6_9MYCO|nr:TIGR03617 family F420-dependent LLM class oxidoreductase [Mycobacterium pinniadriaticum]MCX2934416.1 TIGR03617 family F420-dependent LLM class oxidoreductase [Mycobacterium pinniadriaticum]MCX2940839.1 TIGR03617 family F420-dependent LLM class oxidoreductase [Mycobacterium pinniadriaticum]
MLIDGKIKGDSIASITASACQHESNGYDGAWSSESAHDPFLPLVLAAEHTTGLTLGTSIAVAFARSPMTTAYSAWDLNALAEGRFILGLGSQVQAHVERRFSMPWSRPAARMREFVLAMRAVWTSWQTGGELNFTGDFYRHTLMTPFFSPPRNTFGAPKVFVAAVGGSMTEVAGEVCDGLFPHPFTTARYMREVTLPAVERGISRSGRRRADFQIAHNPLVATARTEEEMAQAVRAVREQVAFYASTPAYRGVLDLHGWSALGIELHELSRSDQADKWTRMGDAVTDEVLHEFAIVAEPADVANALAARWEGLVDRISFYTPYPRDEELFVEILGALKLQVAGAG